MRLRKFLAERGRDEAPVYSLPFQSLNQKARAT